MNPEPASSTDEPADPLVAPDALVLADEDTAFSSPEPAPPKADPYLDDDDDDDDDDVVLPPLPPLPSVRERLVEVLTRPFQAFREHHAGWGWAAPWILVSLLGVLAGVATVANGQLETMVAAQVEQQQETFERKGVELDADAIDFQRKLALFAAKVGGVAGPPLAQLWYMLMFGTVIFLATLLFGEKRSAEPMRCISLAAWCSLAHGVGYLAQAVAALLGSPAPATSMIHLVDPATQPFAGAVLGRIDPVVIYYYLLLSAGLTGSCRLSPAKSALVAGGCYLGLTLLGAAFGLLAGAAG